jgi:hypothetical protein
LICQKLNCFSINFPKAICKALYSVHTNKVEQLCGLMIVTRPGSQESQESQESQGLQESQESQESQ